MREIWSRPLFGDGRRARIEQIEVLGKIGQADIGRIPVVETSLSRDGGVTFGTPRSYGMGALGKFDRRITMRSCGIGRNMALRLRVTDPADLTIYSAVNVNVTEAVR